MYYLLTCPYGPDGAEPALLTYDPDDPRRLWDTGIKFSSDPDDPPFRHEPELPIELTIGNGEGGAMKEMWDAPANVMTKKLADALKQAGVSNIDEYPATITDQETGQVYSDYVAFNVVGLVSATDHARSEYIREIRWFDKLAIDEATARETLMFRLKESTFRLFVHERVKEYLQDQGFETLRFIDPDKLIQRAE